MFFRVFPLNHSTLIAQLGLKPHPEGGHYAELWRDQPADGTRGSASSIHFLLREGEVSHWHKVDAAELWLWHAGAPLLLKMGPEGSTPRQLRLGPNMGEGEHFQGIVPPGEWQSAQSLGEWTLVSCIVAPAFQWEGFEMAPPGWEPGG